MTETIVLVDEKDRPVGYEEKIAAHTNGGKLHRAFSIFVFNSKGEILLQQRAGAKYHFPGLWSNSCCSHPLKGEELEKAVHRKLKQEFGFDTELKEVFTFTYEATDPESRLTEHEFDHAFVGRYDGVPKPNPEEIQDWKWTTPANLKKDLKANPKKFTPWFPIALERLEKKGLVS
ncbi:MAG TPA: isopentenyl-diphosphate Delta-isomerase [Candidatus Bathyarchaeia archaeon]|nr:isopentenyl-diphosphate Delta-isomerase [Candidatus Bathyarchaeia archaeon]